MWTSRDIKSVSDLVIHYSLKYYLVENAWCPETLWTILSPFLFDPGSWFSWVVNKVYIWEDETMKFINMVIIVYTTKLSK